MQSDGSVLNPTNPLERRFRRCVVGLVALVVAFGMLAPCALHAQDATPPASSPATGTFGKLREALKVEPEGKQNPLWIFLGVTVLITALTTVVSALKRDRILRRTTGKYVVLLHETGRFTGILKLILKDVEIASEKTDVKGKDAGRLFPETEFQKLAAVVRYHDELTEKEAQERRAYVERLYHPTLTAKVFRRLQSLGRQFNETVKQIYDRAIGQRLKKRFQGYVGAEQIQALAEAQAEEATGVTTASGASYRLLIDRLIGTRVVAQIGGAEYECILADYTLGGYYHFMDVAFRESWVVNVHRDNFTWLGKWVGNDNGFRINLNRETSTYTIESRVPYPVTLRHARYRGGYAVHNVPVGDQDRNDINLVIPPYGAVSWKAQFHPDHTHEERNVAGDLFQEVRYSIAMRPEYYSVLEFVFETVRQADVIIRYSDNVVQYRAEKFDPQMVSLDTLTEAIWHSKSQFDFQDTEGNRIRGLHLHQGYITNLSKARVDMHDVVEHYSRRWNNESTFEALDMRLRPVRYGLRSAIPSLRGRLAVAQIALIESLRRERRAVAPQSRVLFFPLVRHRREWRLAPPPPKLPVRVGVVTGRLRDEEFAVLSRFRNCAAHHLLYRRLPLDNLDKLSKVDVLWIGYGANVAGNNGFSRLNEDRIRKYVSNGGCVIALAPNMKVARGNRLGWIPDPLVFGKNPVQSGLTVTREGEAIFRHPHGLDLRARSALVWWDDWSERYTPLAFATTEVRGEYHPAAAALLLPYGHGVYIVLGIGPESPTDFAWSAPLAENLLHYAVRWVETQRLRHRKLHVA
jgi:hypothetical protein